MKRWIQRRIEKNRAHTIALTRTVRYFTYFVRHILRRAFTKRLVDKDFHPVFIVGASGSGTTLLAALLHQKYKNALYLAESARMATSGKDLYIKKVHQYPTTRIYQQSLFIPDSVPVNHIKKQILRLYQCELEYPKVSNIVIDKAANSHLTRAKLLKAAFPNSKFVLIFRDPVENIEGMKRKWQPFREDPLEDVCQLWETMHEKFLSDIQPFEQDVLMIEYAQLVKNTDKVVQQIAIFADMEPRDQLAALKDIPASPGKGLRNVVGGEIIVLQDAQKRVESSLSLEDEVFVRNRLDALYHHMQELAN